MPVKCLERCLAHSGCYYYYPMTRPGLYLSVPIPGKTFRQDPEGALGILLSQLPGCKWLSGWASQHVVTTCWQAKDGCTLYGGGICLKAKTKAQFRQLITLVPPSPEHSTAANLGISALKRLYKGSWPSGHATRARSHVECCDLPTQVQTALTEQLQSVSPSGFQVIQWRCTPWHTFLKKPIKILRFPSRLPGSLCLSCQRRKPGHCF